LTAPAGKRSAAVKFIICLGIVSLFADMTYEGAHSSVGAFLKDLGATAAQVGILAGLGEMLGASLRYFSGRLADRTRAYWTLTMLGYAMNVIAVPALAFAGSWKIAALLVIAERTGKAFRGPARDVLLSGATQEVGHGWGFGLHSAMDQTGAVIGPLVMVLAVKRAGSFAPAFLWLAFPAVGTMLALLVARLLNPVQDPKGKSGGPQTMPHVFWMYVAAAGLLAFGVVDWALLAFHFEKNDFFVPSTIPLLYGGAMAINGLTALAFGRMFDRYGLLILAIGILLSVAALPLGFLGGPTAAILAVGCWATGLGAQDACLRAGIAQVTSMNKRGRAFGAFNGVWGIAWFLGSALMGVLYGYSLLALVIAGVTAQLISVVMFLRLRKPIAEAAAVNVA
jgi:hypothetical protein